MAFLAKQVPKIFPSKSRKDHETIQASNGKTKTPFLFRNLTREGKKEDRSVPAPQTPKERPQHQEQLQSPALNCNCNSSDSHSNASTLESSPTLTPRETMDSVTLALPDLPNLTFPPKASDPHVHYTATTNDNCVRTLAPRTTPPHKSDSDSGSIPPVALVSVPKEFSFDLSSSSLLNGEARCLTHAPPRTGDWDDATIESQIDQAETDSQSKSSISEQQQQRKRDELERDVATAQASLIMRPWIEWAARLALLQKIANEKLETNSEQRDANLSLLLQANLQRTRMRHTTRANLRPRPERLAINQRALLSSLEKEKNTTTTVVAIDNNETRNDHQEPELVEPSPRIVKWHMVREPYNGWMMNRSRQNTIQNIIVANDYSIPNPNTNEYIWFAGVAIVFGWLPFHWNPSIEFHVTTVWSQSASELENRGGFRWSQYLHTLQSARVMVFVVFVIGFRSLFGRVEDIRLLGMWNLRGGFQFLVSVAIFDVHVLVDPKMVWGVIRVVCELYGAVMQSLQQAAVAATSTIVL